MTSSTQNQGRRLDCIFILNFLFTFIRRLLDPDPRFSSVHADPDLGSLQLCGSIRIRNTAFCIERKLLSGEQRSQNLSFYKIVQGVFCRFFITRHEPILFSTDEMQPNE